MLGCRDHLSNAVQSNQSDLVEHIEVVQMALVEDELQKDGVRGNVHGFELSGLEPASLVGVEAQVANSLKLNFI